MRTSSAVMREDLAEAAREIHASLRWITCVFGALGTIGAVHALGLKHLPVR